MFELPPRAPKLHAFLTHRYNVFSMSRDIWERVKPPNQEPVLVDLDRTPLQRVSAPGVHAVAQAVEGTEYRVSIYRPDVNDIAKGFLINTDHYRLWEGFPASLNLTQIVNRATTGLDDNLLAYIEERVFLVKDRHGADHWLRDYPASVRLLVDR